MIKTGDRLYIVNKETGCAIIKPILKSIINRTTNQIEKYNVPVTGSLIDPQIHEIEIYEDNTFRLYIKSDNGQKLYLSLPSTDRIDVAYYDKNKNNWNIWKVENENIIGSNYGSTFILQNKGYNWNFLQKYDYYIGKRKNDDNSNIKWTFLPVVTEKYRTPLCKYLDIFPIRKCNNDVMSFCNNEMNIYCKSINYSTSQCKDWLNNQNNNEKKNIPTIIFSIFLLFLVISLIFLFSRRV